MGSKKILDGIMVQHRIEGYTGYVDGTTEIQILAKTNPDGNPLYRVDVGTDKRRITTEQDLLILTDQNGNVILRKKENVETLRALTNQVRTKCSPNKFVKYEKRHSCWKCKRADVIDYQRGEKHRPDCYGVFCPICGYCKMECKSRCP